MGLGLAIVGLGNFGKKIIGPITHFYKKEELYVAAVCDLNNEIVEEIKSECGATGFTDYKQCIDHPDVDIVYIAVPPAAHKEVALYALHKNKHILCEKPLAHDLEDAMTLYEASEKKDVICAMHFGQQYSPVFQTFQSLIDEGFIGEVEHMDLKMEYPIWPPSWQQTDWIMTKAQGGFLLEQGVHFLHFISKLFGTISVNHSNIEYMPNNGCETKVQAELLVKDSLPLLLKGQWPADKEDVTLTVKGTNGQLIIENWRTLKGAQSGQQVAELPLKDPDGWILDHFLDAINRKPAKLSSFKEGYEALEIVEAIRNPITIK